MSPAGTYALKLFSVGYEDAIFCSCLGEDLFIGESLEIEIAQMNSVKALAVTNW